MMCRACTHTSCTLVGGSKSLVVHASKVQSRKAFEQSSSRPYGKRVKFWVAFDDLFLRGAFQNFLRSFMMKCFDIHTLWNKAQISLVDKKTI